MGMYALITCSGCRMNRIADLSAETSVCPYCGAGIKNERAVVKFQSEDQEEVRQALMSLSGALPEKKVRKDTDPISSLAYRFDHCADPEIKLTMLAEELTKILGSFSAADVEEIAPGKSREIIRILSSECIITETEPGRYRA
ncbi:hypothetical protein AOA81_04275 [Methanomassiliicoccales archaeon RumEn M2]|jgi:hypothetical protein|nr:hypothetical protein AOA81_04275 [Methanomassiliicoccales archaeon RumEn M2]